MSNDLLEQSLRGELRERAYSNHPSFAMLFSYARHELEAPERRRVSAHLVGCRRCQEELTAVRFELATLDQALPRLAQEPLSTAGMIERLRALWRSLIERLWRRPALYGHAAAYATVALLLIVLNLQQLQIAAEPGFQGGEASWWVQWPLLAWGAALLGHGYRVWRQGSSRWHD